MSDEWTGNKGVECPAVKELKLALKMAVPNIWVATIAGEESRHTAGLAMDVMLHSQSPAQKPVADAIIDALVSLAPQIGWYDLIYVDWDIDGMAFGFQMPYLSRDKGTPLEKHRTDAGTTSDHKNHLHIDWWPGKGINKWPATANNSGFSTALANAILANAPSGAARDLFAPRGLFMTGWKEAKWEVTTEAASWIYHFDHDGGVDRRASKTPWKVAERGHWDMDGAKLKLIWKDSVEFWNTPIDPSKQLHGEVRPYQGGLHWLVVKKAK